MAEEIQIRNSTEQAKVRSPTAVALLSIFTIFIYFFFWWYFINREMKEFGEANGTDELGTSPGKSVLAVTLGALIIVPAVLSFINTFKRAQAAGRLAGRDDEANGWIGLILYLIFQPLFLAYLQSDLNKTWQRQAQPSEALQQGGTGQTLQADSGTVVTEPAPGAGEPPRA